MNHRNLRFPFGNQKHKLTCRGWLNNRNLDIFWIWQKESRVSFWGWSVAECYRDWTDYWIEIRKALPPECGNRFILKIETRKNLNSKLTVIERPWHEGRVPKKRQIIHILWISVLPFPLSTSEKFNNIHTKDFLSIFAGLPC